MRSKIFLVPATFLFSFCALAQDTTIKKPRTVQVTSTFKPVLKEAAKINLNPVPPSADTSRPRLQYNIPNQNLSFVYQPGTLKPLALQIDSAGAFTNYNYVKIGYGSLKSPYFEGGLSIGDGKTAGMNVYARHTSSQGKRPYQDFSNSNVELNGFFQPTNNLEVNARVGGKAESYNKYGFKPDSLIFSEDSMKVKFNTFRARVAAHNINRTEFGISYAPEINVDVFKDRLYNDELNAYVLLPFQKSLGTQFTLDVKMDASLSRYKPNGRDAISNNYVTIAPSVLYKSGGFSLQAGIRPSWDKGDFKLYPNVTGELGTADKRFTIQAGWIGYLRNSGFQYVAGFNPWIWAPETVMNTKIEERFAGFKGSVGKHVSYSAKVGFNKYNNQPVFFNDTITGKSFQVEYEPQMKVIHIGGEVALTYGEKFSWVNNLAVNQYNSFQKFGKAWGLLPVEFRSSLRLQVLKDLYVKSDLYAFDGAWYLTKDDRGTGKGALDLNAGAEFKVVKNVKVWAQFNNIFNREYERWHQYPVYPFSFMAGVVFSFAQNNQ